MSNISYITTRKHIKSYDIFFLLREINDNRFGGYFSIGQDDGTWSVDWISEDVFDIRTHSTRKLGIKAPNHPWMSYVNVVFRNELGFMTQAILSDEGLEETWKPNPKKYPTYKAWLDILHGDLKKVNLSSYKDLMKVELSMAPKGMRKY